MRPEHTANGPPITPPIYSWLQRVRPFRLVLLPASLRIECVPCERRKAQISSSQLPDITDTDCHIVLVSEWTVGTPERQRATADALVAVGERAPGPPGLLSNNFFASTDGETVLNYALWTSREAYDEFVFAVDVAGWMRRDGARNRRDVGITRVGR